MKKYKFDRNKVFTNLPEDIAEATKRIGGLVAVNDILVKLKDSVEKYEYWSGQEWHRFGVIDNGEV